jgi:hydrogenase expression/formation protein HypD
VDIDKRIKELSGSFGNRKVNILFVSGNHYRSFIQYGIDKFLSKNINAVYGPACVMCQVTASYIDLLIEISHIEKVILTVSPEFLHIKGTSSTLEEERKSGYDVRALYTFQDILLLAKHKRRHKIVFPAFGYDTAAANTAAAVLQAKVAGLFNFTVLSEHKNLLKTLNVWLENGKKIDGIIFTPQDIAVTGTKDLEILSASREVPVSVCGNERDDLSEGLYVTLKNIAFKKNIFWKQDKFEILPQGIEKSQLLINEVFDTGDIYYPGLGYIPSGGYSLNASYMLHNAKKRLNLQNQAEPGNYKENCICNEIINGNMFPGKCNNFKTVCTPLNPVGGCMASKEGLCNIEYLYRNQLPYSL